MEQRVVLTNLAELSPVMQSCMEAGSEVILTVTGNSMRPYLKHQRDQVVLAKCDPHHLQIGDVPLYRRQDGRFVLHRIVGLGASTYTMCGDAQTEKEYAVPADCILAVATGFYRRGKFVSCTAFQYQAYRRFWMAAFPVRPLLLRLDSLARRAVRKLRAIGRKGEK